MVPRLSDDLLHDRRSIRIVAGPGVARPFPGNRPCIVIINATTANGLQAGQIPDAARPGSGVEIAGMIVRKACRWRASRSSATAWRSRAASASRRQEVVVSLNRISPFPGIETTAARVAQGTSAASANRRSKTSTILCGHRVAIALPPYRSSPGNLAARTSH
jgi:hypothetical protein